MLLLEKIQPYLIQGVAALFAIMLHEIAHGYVAHRLGDPTAKEMGRLSLNPIKHVDLFGLIMLIVVGFGWAKPVPVDMRYLQFPKRDMCLVSLAGPGMNFCLAFLSMLALGFMFAFSAVVGWLTAFLYTFAMINVGLGVFNLFPIPPLDGSKAIGIFLPDRVYYTVLRYERYGMAVLMVLLMSGVLNEPLYILRSGIMDGFGAAVNAIAGVDILWTR